MHVAFVSMGTDRHDDAAGIRGVARGGPARTRRTAEALAAAGHEVTVFCAGWWEEASVPRFDHGGVTYRRLTDDLASAEFAARLPTALGRAGPDVIQVRPDPPSHVLAAGGVGALTRTPVVVDWWGQRGDGYGRVVAAADAVVVPSEAVRTRVREYGADADDTVVVPESVEMAAVRAAPVSERADVVYARDLDDDANVETFLLALAELRDREWRAAVIGDGPKRGDAERTARDLRIDDRVEFLGDLPREERLAIYRGAHVFAQTAEREPFPTELLWALACGCLGVVQYQGESGAHELVEGRDRGRLVTDAAELAGEIVAAAGGDRLTVDETFAAYDREAVAERYVDCYRRRVDAAGWL